VISGKDLWSTPMKILASSFSLVLLALAAGCGSDSKPNKADSVGLDSRGTVDLGGSCTASSTPQPFLGSCDQPGGLKQCWELTGSLWSDTSLAKASCSGGYYSDTTRCAATAVGRCLRNCGLNSEMVMFYSDGDAKTLQDGCEAKGFGTWLGK